MKCIVPDHQFHLRLGLAMPMILLILPVLWAGCSGLGVGVADVNIRQSKAREIKAYADNNKAKLDKGWLDSLSKKRLIFPLQADIPQDVIKKMLYLEFSPEVISGAELEKAQNLYWAHIEAVFNARIHLSEYGKYSIVVVPSEIQNNFASRSETHLIALVYEDKIVSFKWIWVGFGWYYSLQKSEAFVLPYLVRVLGEGPPQEVRRCSP